VNVRIHNIPWEEKESVYIWPIDGRNLKYQPFRRAPRRMQVATNNERVAAMLIDTGVFMGGKNKFFGGYWLSVDELRSLILLRGSTLVLNLAGVKSTYSSSAARVDKK
jgi:hypothetical protein